LIDLKFFRCSSRDNYYSLTLLAMVYKLSSGGFRLRCNQYFGQFSHDRSSKNAWLAVYPSNCRSLDNANIQKTDHQLFY
jgi:hypothetical protein